MKLIQLNIWGGRLTKKFIDFLKHEQPDVVCMQEVFSGGQGILIPNDQFDALELIVENGNFKDSFLAAKYSLDYSGHSVRYGNAMIAKTDLANQRIQFIKGSYTEHIDPASPLTCRDEGPYNLQLATITTATGQTVTIANHHGFWQPDPIGTEVSVDCMTAVANVLKEISGPLILAGDLNVVPQSPAMRVFDDFLEDLTAKHHPPSTLGKLHFLDSAVPCDHILVSSGITVESFRVSDPLASDHQALVLDFTI